MKTIDITNKKELASGAFGRYYRLTKGKGIKVYFIGSEKKTDVRYTIEYENALAELKNLKHCYKRTNLTPKPYELVYVKYNNGCECCPEYSYSIGIIMQHCEGVKIEDAPMSWDRRQCILADAKQKFEKLTGMFHNDLHSGNLIYNKKTGRYKVIDLDVNASVVEG